MTLIKVILSCVLCLVATLAAAQNPHPMYPTVVLSDTFVGTVDINATGGPYYKWYPQGWFGAPATPPSSIQLVPPNGVTLTGGINSAFASVSVPSHFIGTVFGGGAYFEAAILFDPAKATDACYWPSFTTMAIEHVFDSTNAYADDQWPGQTQGYVHFIEPDIFEAYHACNQTYVGKNSYLTTLHDWSGTFIPGSGWQHNIANFWENTLVTNQTNWNIWHIYGMLWVPQNGATPGYVQWFFDNNPGPKMYYIAPIGSPPLSGQASGHFEPDTPASAAATYSILDSQRLAISLGTDPNWPMSVKWVRVWQK